MNINELIAERNRIENLIYAHKIEQVNKNTPILIEEVVKFIDKIGKGFTEGDYYPHERYYSKIQGVKNFTINEGTILCKIVCPVNLPSEITVIGKTWNVKTFKSSKYSEEVIDFS